MLTISTGLINYIVITITYICFHRACKVQGIDRRSFSYFAWLQPHCAWMSLVWMIIVTCVYGYPSYKPWSLSTFWSSYTMQIVIPPLFIIWKVIKRTKFVRSHEADLVWERPLIDAYEDSFLEPPTGFWREMLQLVGIGRSRSDDARRHSVAPVSSNEPSKA